jgi:hypothetical protein
MHFMSQYRDLERAGRACCDPYGSRLQISSSPCRFVADEADPAAAGRGRQRIQRIMNDDGRSRRQGRGFYFVARPAD